MTVLEVCQKNLGVKSKLTLSHHPKLSELILCRVGGKKLDFESCLFSALKRDCMCINISPSLCCAFFSLNRTSGLDGI